MHRRGERKSKQKKRMICEADNIKKRKVMHCGPALQRLQIHRDLRVKKPLRNNNKTLGNCCSHTHLLAEAENKRGGQRERDTHLYPKTVLRPHVGKASIKSDNNLVLFKVLVCIPVQNWG